MTVPVASGSSPNSALARVDRPEPTSPASPTISPRPTVKLMSRSLPEVASPLTSRAMSEFAACGGATASASVAPLEAVLVFDISSETSRIEVAEGASGPISLPSLTMLRRLARRKISAIRWLI